jgi:hypothetical protein
LAPRPARTLASTAACLGALLVFAQPSLADSEASFTYSPSVPLTGQVVTFASTSTGSVTSTSWDLDNDGFCDDATGVVTQRTFQVAGRYGISVCTNSGESELKRTITVANRPPLASFTVSPAEPVVGQLVTLASTSFDPDGPIVGDDWLLNPAGPLSNAGAAMVTRSWPKPGVYPVTLKVLDSNGASGVNTRWIKVHHPPLELLSPFPVVRLAGRLTRSGADVSSLVVQAPRGTRVSLRCHGRRCPYKRAAARSRKGQVRFRRLQRFLPAGTVLELSATKRGTIGKYTRFRIRAGHSPLRVDRCLKAGAKKPVRCPSS